MKRGTFTVRQITLYAAGIALFVVVGCMIPIPIPNTSAHIDLGYTIMAIYAYLFGPIAGLLVGGFGRFLEDMILFGSIGSPGWLIASFSMGFLLGLIFRYTKQMKNQTVATTLAVLGTLIVNAVFLIGFAPFISSLWNGVPYVAKLPSGISAFATNSVAIAVLGMPLGKLLEKIAGKYIHK